MKAISFKTAKELKKATRTGLGFSRPNFEVSEIESINGYVLGVLSPDITQKGVSVYDVENQDSVHLYPPYNVKLKAL